MLGFGRKEREPGRSVPINSINYNAPAPRPAQAEENKRKAFCIALSWKGLFGLIALFFILEVWMFLFGMWAAQTIVFPTPQHALRHPEKAAGRTVEAAKPVKEQARPKAAEGHKPEPVQVEKSVQKGGGGSTDREEDDGVFRGAAPPSW